jgi:hypothetical protein
MLFHSPLAVIFENVNLSLMTPENSESDVMTPEKVIVIWLQLPVFYNLPWFLMQSYSTGGCEFTAKSRPAEVDSSSLSPWLKYRM